MFSAKHLLIMTGLLIVSSATVANAADCRKIEELKKRLDCIEDRIDHTPPIDLKGVKIESSQANGQCINYIDQKSVIESRPCGTDYGSWNIHK